MPETEETGVETKPHEHQWLAVSRTEMYEDPVTYEKLAEPTVICRFRCRLCPATTYGPPDE